MGGEANHGSTRRKIMTEQERRWIGARLEQVELPRWRQFIAVWVGLVWRAARAAPWGF